MLHKVIPQATSTITFPEVTALLPELTTRLQQLQTKVTAFLSSETHIQKLSEDLQSWYLNLNITLQNLQKIAELKQAEEIFQKQDGGFKIEEVDILMDSNQIIPSAKLVLQTEIREILKEFFRLKQEIPKQKYKFGIGLTSRGRQAKESCISVANDFAEFAQWFDSFSKKLDELSLCQGNKIFAEREAQNSESNKTLTDEDSSYRKVDSQQSKSSGSTRAMLESLDINSFSVHPLARKYNCLELDRLKTELKASQEDLVQLNGKYQELKNVMDKTLNPDISNIITRLLHEKYKLAEELKKVEEENKQLRHDLAEVNNPPPQPPPPLQPRRAASPQPKKSNLI